MKGLGPTKDGTHRYRGSFGDASATGYACRASVKLRGQA